MANKENNPELQYLDNLKYLNSQIYLMEDLVYFDNIRKYPTESFLLGIYNFISVLREHNLHIAVTTTKVPSEPHVKELIKIMYSNTCENDASVSEQFEAYLKQFKSKSYSDGYYKKFAATLPIDKLSNDLCQIVLEKSWVYVVASLATFEYIINTINAKLNAFAFDLKNEEVRELCEIDPIHKKLLCLLNGDTVKFSEDVANHKKILCLLDGASIQLSEDPNNTSKVFRQMKLFEDENNHKKLSDLLNGTSVMKLSEDNSNYKKLLRLLNGEDKAEIKQAISETVTIFCSFFNEINNLYYSD